MCYWLEIYKKGSFAVNYFYLDCDSMDYDVTLKAGLADALINII